MSTQLNAPDAPPAPTDAPLSRESGERLTEVVVLQDYHVLQQISLDDESGETVAIPRAAAHLLTVILAEMTQGNLVTLIPMHAELSVGQAAELLNVSRLYLNALLDQGAIPHRNVGTHRQIVYRDLLEYKQTIDALRRKALKELSALDQELGFGY